MRIAVLSDIHGNLPALKAVLKTLERHHYDTIISLGDQVGYGPYPNEVIDLLRERSVPTVLGNHDAGAVERISLRMFREPNQSLLAWTRDHLTSENRRYLTEAPLVMEQDNWIAAHASPVSPDHWPYLDSAPACRRVLDQISRPICLVGHTHVPGIVSDHIGVLSVKPGHRFVINPGSIGQPRDGSRDAAFGILDTEAFTWEPLRVSWVLNNTLAGYERIGIDERTARRLLSL